MAGRKVRDLNDPDVLWTVQEKREFREMYKEMIKPMFARYKPEVVLNIWRRTIGEAMYPNAWKRYCRRTWPDRFN